MPDGERLAHLVVIGEHESGGKRGFDFQRMTWVDR
jgi:hypothetical protein